MKPNHAKPARGGFTGWDLLICVVTVVLLAGVLLPALVRPRRGGTHINCVSSLKQIGLAFRMWANDHGDKFPMQSSALDTNGGTIEFNLTGDVWRHFQVLSNELSTPKILACQSDNRTRVTDWGNFTNNSHLSYFVGLDADETKPQSILSGDHNVTTSKVKPVNGVLTLSAGDSLEWTTGMHNKNGNVGLADGSVAQLTIDNLNKQLQAAVKSTGQSVHRLALPE